MRPYSEDLRERAVQRAAAGETIRSIAAALRISPSCVSEWRKRQRETGALTPGQMGGHKPRSLSGACADWLRTRHQDRSARCVVFPGCEGLSLKKFVPPRRDTAFKRARWKAHQDMVDPRRPVFIDETWIKTNMAPLRGWGLGEQRLDARVPHGHWKTLNFIPALRHDRIDAPWVINGPPGGGMGGMNF